MRIIGWPNTATYTSDPYKRLKYDLSMFISIIAIDSCLALLKLLLTALNGQMTSFDAEDFAKYAFVAIVSLSKALTSGALLNGTLMRPRRRLALVLLLGVFISAATLLIANVGFVILTVASGWAGILRSLQFLLELFMWTVQDSVTCLVAAITAFRMIKKTDYEPYIWSVPFSFRHAFSVAALAFVCSVVQAHISTESDPLTAIDPTLGGVLVVGGGLVVSMLGTIVLVLIPGIDHFVSQDSVKTRRIFDTFCREDIIFLFGTSSILAAFVLQAIVNDNNLSNLGWVVFIIQSIASISTVGSAYSVLATHFPSQLQPILMLCLPACITSVTTEVAIAHHTLFAASQWTAVYGSLGRYTDIARAAFLLCLIVSAAVPLFCLNHDTDVKRASDFDVEVEKRNNRASLEYEEIINLTEVSEFDTKRRQIAIFVILFVSLILAAISYISMNDSVSEDVNAWWPLVNCDIHDMACKASRKLAIDRRIAMGAAGDDLKRVLHRSLITLGPFVFALFSVAGIGGVMLIVAPLPAIFLFIAQSPKFDSDSVRLFGLEASVATMSLFLTLALAVCFSVVRDLNREALLPCVFAQAVFRMGCIVGDFTHTFTNQLDSTTVATSLNAMIGAMQLISAVMVIAHPFFHIGRCGFDSINQRVGRTVRRLVFGRKTDRFGPQGLA
ncbi:hypothetical protein J8273_0788 [Carpediemonas membranifera]|uniref:Transmembrane protein n=1 Tax=Carpediemonas membranifera TaxID=201153 RepID=A0A8J6E4U9_9EUKA|nr:hypothetical protein J8273_0788 [Carpediemonas membranifera]|eukprot:KAG9397658.1 hypothetical protein J8273_0788 [Carpediemonas membranifera]